MKRVRTLNQSSSSIAQIDKCHNPSLTSLKLSLAIPDINVIDHALLQINIREDADDRSDREQITKQLESTYVNITEEQVSTQS